MVLGWPTGHRQQKQAEWSVLALVCLSSAGPQECWGTARRARMPGSVLETGVDWVVWSVAEHQNLWVSSEPFLPAADSGAGGG